MLVLIDLFCQIAVIMTGDLSEAKILSKLLKNI